MTLDERARENEEKIKEAIGTLFELREDLTDEQIFDLNELIRVCN